MHIYMDVSPRPAKKNQQKKKYRLPRLRTAYCQTRCGLAETGEDFGRMGDRMRGAGDIIVR